MNAKTTYLMRNHIGGCVGILSNMGSPSRSTKPQHTPLLPLINRRMDQTTLCVPTVPNIRIALHRVETVALPTRRKWDLRLATEKLGSFRKNSFFPCAFGRSP